MKAVRTIATVRALVLTLALVAAHAPAQLQPDARARPQTPEQRRTEGILSADPAVRDAAVREVWGLLERPSHVIGAMARSYLPALNEAGLHEQAADWARITMIEATPRDLGLLEQVQTERIKGLLGMGKAKEALAEAKSLFNASSMRNTDKAILLVTQCLEAAHPDDPGIAQRFKLQQLLGAKATPDGEAIPSEILRQIEVDSQAYLNASRLLVRDDWESLVRKGNLLLLADDIEGAWDAFDRAYEVAPERELRHPAEGLARVLKAEDGTIGRANAWVLSIRPDDAEQASAEQ